MAINDCDNGMEFRCVNYDDVHTRALVIRMARWSHSHTPWADSIPARISKACTMMLESGILHWVVGPVHGFVSGGASVTHTKPIYPKCRQQATPKKEKYIIAEKRSRICSHHLNGLPKIACDEKALSCHLLGVWVCVCDWRPIEFQCIAFQSNWHIAVSSPLSDTRSQIRYNLSFFLRHIFSHSIRHSASNLHPAS